jgi:multidrug efflux pump subunit AcrA (membrane-fusion protein)
VSGAAAPAPSDGSARAVAPTTGTVKVTVKIPASSHLRPGSFARVNIVTDTHGDALVVPRLALVAEGSRWHLFRVNQADETVEQLEVRLGFEEGERVEILAVVGENGPLAPGHPVVIVGAPALTDGARVEVMDAEEGDAGASS